MPHRAFITLIEDDPDDIDLTLRALGLEGHRHVQVARDGAEALELLWTADAGDDPLRGLPSLVLLDLHLPHLDGHEVLQRLRDDARTHMMPIVMLSSSCHEHDVRRAYTAGANSYIHKPIDSARFEQTVRTLSTYWLRLNHAPGQTRFFSSA